MSPQRQQAKGMFPSLKMATKVYYHGQLNRELLYFLEYDPAVLRYYTYPFPIVGSTEQGTPCTHWPDYLLERSDGKELIKCARAQYSAKPALQHSHETMAAWAQVHGYRFRVITDIDLHTGARLANLQLLWRYALSIIAPGVVTQCISLLSYTQSAVPLVTLAAHLARSRPVLSLAPVVYHLLFRKVLLTNLDQPLTPQSPIWLAPEIA